MKCLISAIVLLTFIAVDAQVLADSPTEDSTSTVTLNQQADGYRGIWYYNQRLNNEYVFKYSGGLGTYCANHSPFSVYSPTANKTFFCYGGTTPESFTRLVHMVSYYDHATGEVPKPTVLLDKKTNDAHDNPVISLDQEGHIWIFSTSHGRGRPSYIHRSKQPYDVTEFEQVDATYELDGQEVPLNNFSYLQAWHHPEQGFICFFTHYNNPAPRTNMYMTSKDGVKWSAWTRLSAIEQGHYQNSAIRSDKVATTYNYHPNKLGLNYRTNVYYMESPDFGNSWQTVDGQQLELPVVDKTSPALVYDYEAEGLKVYIMDLTFDPAGNPIILYITTRGFESGPENGPRTWTVAHWTGQKWEIHPVTESDNNYDLGALYVDDAQNWRIIGPTETGPQAFNPGGEIALWTTSDAGKTWTKQKQLTSGSEMNHTFARRSVNGHPGFLSFWADGHGRQPSKSRLFFSTQDGDVFMLPETMTEATAKPILIKPMP